MATPEPHPYRQLNYPVNNLEQNFDQTKKIQVRANIGIPTSVNKTGQVLTVGNSTGELEWSTVSCGGDLPSSSSADEGKVLTVDSNGEPQWSPPLDGDDIFLATYGTTTFDEIRTAHNAGKAVFLYAQAVNYNSGILVALDTCFRSNYADSSVAKFILPFKDWSSVGANSRIQQNTIYAVDGNNVWSTTNVPAIASPEATDVGKIYMATAAGNAMWANQRTPGNMLSVTNNQIDVTTTAGITDIQMVNALPANPVATVLYLIPAT